MNKLFNYIEKNRLRREYRKFFNEKKSNTIENTRFVVFDTETTGLNTKTDKILSIGAVAVCNNTIDTDDSIELYLSQKVFNSETVKIHGLLKHGNKQKTDEKTAVNQFVSYLRNDIIIAHHAAFDLTMINQVRKKQGLPKLKNKIIDTGILYKKLIGTQNKHYSLDYLCKKFNIHKHDRHTASGDAYITALLFIKILSKLKNKQKIRLSDLFEKKQGLL